jgi:hypothetical protein
MRRQVQEKTKAAQRAQRALAAKAGAAKVSPLMAIALQQSAAAATTTTTAAANTTSSSSSSSSSATKAGAAVASASTAASANKQGENSSSSGTANNGDTSLFGDIDAKDLYDPASPNDYEAAGRCNPRTHVWCHQSLLLRAFAIKHSLTL